MKANLGIACLFTAILTLTASGQSVVRKSPELAFSVPGQGQKLLSQYRGKTVALEFVLTTCPHCQAAAGVMNKMQQKYGSGGFQALDVAINHDADLLVEHFAKEYQISFPVGWTSLEQMMAYMGFSERPVVPQLILIDSAGNIRYQTPRLGDSESMREDVIGHRIEELIDLGNQSKARTNAHLSKLASR